jgi:hypothetical protein
LRAFTYINADIYQGRYVGGVKGFKVHGADFTCSVATVQLFSKVQTDFWDDKVASNRQGAQEIFDGIVSDFSKRDLRPSDDHRFSRKRDGDELSDQVAQSQEAYPSSSSMKLRALAV